MTRTLAMILLGTSASSAGAQTLTATCDSFAQVFASAPAGATIRLSGSCGPILLRNRHEPLIVEARSGPVAEVSVPPADVRGLTLTNVSNLTWRGGTIRAEGGFEPSSPVLGYAVRLTRGQNIEFEGVRLTGAVRGIVISNSNDVRIRHGVFEGLRSDGVNFVDSQGLLLESSRFRDFRPRPKICTRPDGTTVENISQKACENGGGTFRDGDHADIFQTWSNSSDILIRNNDIFTPLPGWSQGITTFGAQTVRSMRVLDNRVVTDHANAIVVARCTDGCLVRGNHVSRASNEAPWAVGIRLEGGTTVACGNVVTDPRRPLGTEPC